MSEYDDLNLENVPLATRLKHEIKLFSVIEKVWKETAKNRATFPRGYERKKTHILMSDVKKGIKIIRRKNKMYVEMPTLQSVGNGQVKRVYDKELEIKPSDEEIEVQLPVVESTKCLPE